MAHRLAPQARADLDQIWDYVLLETGSESTADRTIDTIAERFYLLAQWPRIGRVRNDLRRRLAQPPGGRLPDFLPHQSWRHRHIAGAPWPTRHRLSVPPVTRAGSS